MTRSSTLTIPRLLDASSIKRVALAGSGFGVDGNRAAVDLDLQLLHAEFSPRTDCGAERSAVTGILRARRNFDAVGDAAHAGEIVQRILGARFCASILNTVLRSAGDIHNRDTSSHYPTSKALNPAC